MATREFHQHLDHLNAVRIKYGQIVAEHPERSPEDGTYYAHKDRPTTKREIDMVLPTIA